MDADLVSIVMTGHGTIHTAVEAMKCGAHDYILKPFNLSVIVSVLSRAVAVRRLRQQNTALLQRVADRTAELEAANRELQASNRELENFAHSVSHDLRAPLRAIEGFARVLLDDFGGLLPAAAQKLLDRIAGKACDVSRLVEDLLRFSHLSRQPLAKQSVDVRQLVHDALDELRAQDPDRDVAVLVGDLPDAYADPALIKQVLLNLEANALKFTRRTDNAVIAIEGSRSSGQCLYSIRDNGAGFDMRDADKLFGIFQRLHGADEFEGTGVGLSLVRRIIERHGGTIWAEAEVNRGAKFTFTLPDQ